MNASSWRFSVTLGLIVAGFRLVAAALLIALVLMTSDPEPWHFPHQLDIPTVVVCRMLWLSTGWPAQYNGPADPVFLLVSLITWFAIGAVFAIPLILRQRWFEKRFAASRNRLGPGPNGAP
jgi:hypothetical protein